MWPITKPSFLQEEGGEKNHDLWGRFESFGHNLVTVYPPAGASGLGVLDFLNEPALIGSLGDNGGDTLTHTLLLGSLAIGGASANGAPGFDQRGVERPPGRIDIGAFHSVLAPLIINQPQSQIVVPGQTITLNVVAQGQALSYQWQFQGSDIAGAIGASLTIEQVTDAQDGPYRVLVRSPNGSIASLEAILIVKPTLRIQRSGSSLVLSWSNGGLQTATQPLGPWLDLPNISSPYSVNIGEKSGFYRVAR